MVVRSDRPTSVSDSYGTLVFSLSLSYFSYVSIGYRISVARNFCVTCRIVGSGGVLVRLRGHSCLYTGQLGSLVYILHLLFQ